MASSTDIADMRKDRRAQGPATILAIGTANPSTCMYQADYPDYYFRVTESEHMVDFKDKFKRICDKSMIRKRYAHQTEKFLKQNPNVCDYTAGSLNVSQDLLVVQVPKLGKEAATKAIKEWGQPKFNITHLIFCTTSSVDMPGADYHLVNLLGLSPSVKRFMMYQQGCHAGGTVRLAKDLAENNKSARILVVCCEMTAIAFRGPNPNDAHLDYLVSQALFGDGAAAVIMGSDLDLTNEKPLFEIVSSSQTFIPNTEEL